MVLELWGLSCGWVYAAHAALPKSVSLGQSRLCVGRDSSVGTCVCGMMMPCACGTRISGDRRWMPLLWEAQAGLCGLLEGAKQQLEGWQSSDSRDTFLRPELKSPARSESMQRTENLNVGFLFVF